jgi:phosphoenolpyruvate carboxykinase (ATP)
MEELGMTNPDNRLAAAGFENLASVRYNFSEPELYEDAIRNGEAVLTANGALRALTGQHTGRSPKDKFIVRDANTENNIWWDNNKPMSPEHFAVLKADMLAHAAGKTLYVQDLIGGADPANALPIRSWT